MYNFIKRLFDVVVALVFLPFFAVIFIFVAIAIKLDDGGPIFYHDHRIAKGGGEFIMLKFRSMKVNAPLLVNKDGSSYNSKDDPRLTRIGNFIRETSIDETPQVLNVLIGQMSIIGPRASGFSALDTYKEDELPKLSVRPGITGYTQAYFRNSITTREKRLKDAWYAQNASLWLDTKIFFKTIATVFKHDNIYTNDTSADISQTVVWGEKTGGNDAIKAMNDGNKED